MKHSDVYLNGHEFIHLYKHAINIGEGTNGICYLYNGKVYKIYHRNLGDIRLFKYYDSQHNLLKFRDAKKRIQEKREKIINSTLPIGTIYIDNVPSGVIYPYFFLTKSIYFASVLPMKKRLEICHVLLHKVKELIENNVYPFDLSNHNKTHFYSKKSANILLGVLSLEPQIIDLDGKSTIYTDTYQKNYEAITAFQLMIVIATILSRTNINTLLDDEYLDNLIEIFNGIGFNDDTISAFIDQHLLLDDIEESLLRLKK